MFNFDDYLLRAKSRLLEEPASGFYRSDAGAFDDEAHWPDGRNPVAAAVLVPIVLRDEPTVLLTLRQDKLKKHGGQIAFPGGRCDAGETAAQTALREAAEEIGLAPAHSSVLGFLPNYYTISNYLVTPVVALVQPHFELTLQEAEVADAFEVPLSFLMSLDNCAEDGREWKLVMRRYYVYQFEQRRIWGATAGMIRVLYDQLYT